MLQKRFFIDALLLASLVIITGCAPSGSYKNDASRFHRISSNECISFGHVVGSEGYNQCMEKKLREVLPQVMKAARQGGDGARSRALSICLELAKQGDTSAMYNVGYMCLEGWGGKQDADICMRWLKTAARSGHVRSAKVLSGIYSEGKFGITPDEEKAAYWVNLLAEEEFAKGESGTVESKDEVATGSRIGREIQRSSGQVVTVDEQLPVQSAVVDSETQIEKLPQFEPETVNIPPPEGDTHVTEAVCRAFVFTGSRFKYRVCATSEEWAEIDNKNQKKTDEFVRDFNEGSSSNLGLPEEGMAGHMPR